MNKLICLIGMIFSCGICSGQNLVPNGGFEVFITCPILANQLSLASPWFNPALLTPDYYNACSSTVGIPVNAMGNQISNNGNAYAGFFASQLNSSQVIREYICAPLMQPLQAGINYSVQFYLSLSDHSLYGVTTLGAFLGDTNGISLNGYVINAVPQIENTTNALTDQTAWMLVDGTFTATGNEQFIMIGNFKDDANCGIQAASGGINNYSYYYIDDISVTLTTGINESYENIFVNVYPSPFNDVLHVQVNFREISDIVLYDIAKRKLLHQAFSNSTILNTAHLEKGIYLYEVRNKKGVIKKGKIVKE